MYSAVWNIYVCVWTAVYKNKVHGLGGPCLLFSKCFAVAAVSASTCIKVFPRRMVPCVQLMLECSLACSATIVAILLNKVCFVCYKISLREQVLLENPEIMWKYSKYCECCIHRLYTLLQIAKGDVKHRQWPWLKCTDMWPLSWAKKVDVHGHSNAMYSQILSTWQCATRLSALCIFFRCQPALLVNMIFA